MSVPLHDHEVHVREHPLPGNARMFTLTLADGSVVTLSSQGDSTERAMQVTPPDAEEPTATLTFSAPESTTLAALLSGIRFVVQQPDEHQPGDRVVIVGRPGSMSEMVRHLTG